MAREYEKALLRLETALVTSKKKTRFYRCKNILLHGLDDLRYCCGSRTTATTRCRRRLPTFFFTASCFFVKCACIDMISCVVVPCHLLLPKIFLGGTIPLDRSLKWFSFRNLRNRMPCLWHDPFTGRTPNSESNGK